tara:strand:+ start:1052 stop:1258 length:207 start_codon:yes stop_codon:yes gene_type:complete
MFDNPEMMLGFGWALGIVAGINIARFCWPDEGVWLGELRQKEKDLWMRIRELEQKEQALLHDKQQRES